MANVLYEKTPRLPSARHSLKRALLLTVWLRRQEMQVKQVEVMAMGLADVVAQKDASRLSKAFKEFIEAAYPFATKVRGAEDAQMVRAMQKEVAAGPISFQAVQTNPLQKAAARVRLPDDFMQKLRNRKK